MWPFRVGVRVRDVRGCECGSNLHLKLPSLLDVMEGEINQSETGQLLMPS